MRALGWLVFLAVLAVGGLALIPIFEDQSVQSAVAVAPDLVDPTADSASRIAERAQAQAALHSVTFEPGSLAVEVEAGSGGSMLVSQQVLIHARYRRPVLAWLPWTKLVNLEVRTTYRGTGQASRFAQAEP